MTLIEKTFMSSMSRETSLRDMIRGRESTNQQLLRLYEKMYSDLFPQPADKA